MADPFLGEIRLVGFNFAPRGWADCNGQILPINQNTALFSLLGTMYGGNGITTFALPNLQGRVAVHEGAGHTQGEQAGSEAVTLTVAQMPAHSHAFRAVAGDQDSDVATNHLLSTGNFYANPPSNTAMAAESISAAGGSQPHDNMQPYLVLRYIIALQGIFPSRN